MSIRIPTDPGSALLARWVGFHGLVPAQSSLGTSNEGQSRLLFFSGHIARTRTSVASLEPFLGLLLGTMARDRHFKKDIRFFMVKWPIFAGFHQIWTSEGPNLVKIISTRA